MQEKMEGESDHSNDSQTEFERDSDINENYSNSGDTSDGDSSADSSNEEEKLLQKAISEKLASKIAAAEEKGKSKILATLCSWNWENIVIIMCLWVAYLLCNIAYSTIGPFFPREVILIRLAIPQINFLFLIPMKTYIGIIAFF